MKVGGAVCLSSFYLAPWEGFEPPMPFRDGTLTACCNTAMRPRNAKVSFTSIAFKTQNGSGRGIRTRSLTRLTAEHKHLVYEPTILVYYFFDEGEGKQHLFQILKYPVCTDEKHIEPLVLLV